MYSSYNKLFKKKLIAYFQVCGQISGDTTTNLCNAVVLLDFACTCCSFTADSSWPTLFSWCPHQLWDMICSKKRSVL